MQSTKRHNAKAWIAGALMIGTLINFAPAIGHAGAERQITEGSKVTIAFTITIPENNIVIPENVSEYVPGQHEILPALEEALTGMYPGEHKRIDLPAERAFGPYDESKKIRVPREQLPPDARTGTILETTTGEPVTIVELSASDAVVDFNHPLAGKHLVLDVRILDVEPQASGTRGSDI